MRAACPIVLLTMSISWRQFGQIWLRIEHGLSSSVATAINPRSGLITPAIVTAVFGEDDVVADNLILDKWIKSSRCGPQANTNCVEFRRCIADLVAVRDSKGDGTVLVVTGTSWRAFLGHCRSGS